MGSKAQIAKSKKNERNAKFDTRKVNRCRVCGRARGYQRMFGLCRICLRQRALAGDIPGLRISSW